MMSENPERLGRLDDEAEQQEPSDTTQGAAARGDYDPAQGSPGEGSGQEPPQERPDGES